MESLLCSGKKESIELSLSYMEGDMESSTQSMTSSTGSALSSLIPYKQAVGKSYFSSVPCYILYMTVARRNY